MGLRVIAATAWLWATPALAAYYDAYQIDNIYENEQSGLRFYEQGDYRRAFGLLTKTAALGMKRSQYILGFMFMKGEGIDRNMLFGLAWLGLSTESGNEEWQATFDQFYEKLSAAQRAMLDDKIEEYRAKFGATVQGITCAKTAVVGSRRIDWVCRKGEGHYEEHEIELPIRAE